MNREDKNYTPPPPIPPKKKENLEKFMPSKVYTHTLMPSVLYLGIGHARNPLLDLIQESRQLFFDSSSIGFSGS